MTKEITSYESLKQVISKTDKAYLLLFKKGNEKSDCAFENYLQAGKMVKDIELYFADVTTTRDIHIQYNITTAPVLLEFEQGIFKNQVKGCQLPEQYKALFEEALYQAEIKTNEKPQKRVTVYSTPTCSWCNTLKGYLKKHRVKFTDVDVSKDQRAADELVKRSGQMGVPQTDINGEIIVGFNQARINQLLDIQG
jgi:glutaredoxin-like YruB-family protein